MKYKYDIIRSQRNSMSVSISGENRITVRCSWSMPAEKIEKFLDAKAEWIDRIIMRNAKRLAANDDVIEFRKIYFDGEQLPLVVGDCNKVTSEAVYVKSFDDIEKLYIDTCSAEFTGAVYKAAEVAKLYPNSVSVKKYRGRWGCCDAKNNLVFNYLLFMLPPPVRHYVIIHELCHTLCHNHSPAFWKLVSDYEPDYKNLKKQLAAFDFLTSLY